MLEMWAAGVLTDDDVVEAIASHGGFRDYQSTRHSLHDDAQALADACAEYLR